MSEAIKKIDSILESLDKALKITKDLYGEIGKEPCAHEPIESRNSMTWIGRDNEVKIQEIGEPYYQMICKHPGCGAKIKAKEWVEV